MYDLEADHANFRKHLWKDVLEDAKYNNEPIASSIARADEVVKAFDNTFPAPKTKKRG